MFKPIVVTGLFLSALAGWTPADPTPVAPTARVELFNHRNLDGWTPWLKATGASDPKHVFTVQDGVIHISGEDWGGIATTGAWRDYRLVVEWKWGTKTWGERTKAARDSGILVHAVGEDGAAGGTWLESIESQVIEGGAGDFIMVAGKGHPSVTADVREEANARDPKADKEIYWQKGAPARVVHEGRVNWYGRDPAWQDVIGFRGTKDVERPTGEWNRQEIVADGDALTTWVNGVQVNAVTKASHRAGRIQIQSEGAEILVRTVELQPLH
jgi:hypothetical protein